MAGLPVVGEYGWGPKLNEFLLVGHNADGTLKETPPQPPLLATIELDSAEILALADAPFELIPAPGTGKMLAPLFIMWAARGTTPYSNVTNFEYRLGASGRSTLESNEGLSLALTEVEGYGEAGVLPWKNGDGWQGSSTSSGNQPLELVASTAPAGGDATATIQVLYAVLDIGV